MRMSFVDDVLVVGDISWVNLSVLSLLQFLVLRSFWILGYSGCDVA